MDDKIIHIHFGAGNLGIGLTLPAISKNVRLVVFQNRSLGDLHSNEIIKLSNQEEYNQTMKVVTDDIDLDYAKNIYSGWKTNENKPLFIYVNKWENYEYIIKEADSISCAVKGGQSRLSQLLNKIEFVSKPYVLPFENDLHTSLEKNTNITLVKIVSDRICVGRPDLIENNEISVLAEKNGEIIINSEDNKIKQIFNSSNNIIIKFKANPKIFEYYKDKKKSLVNGLHFVLATLGYFLLDNNQIPFDDWEKQYLPIIQKTLFSKEIEWFSHIENYIDGQIMRLILEYGDDIKSEYNVQMNQEDLFDILRTDYEKVLARLISQPDNLTRILDYNNQEKHYIKYENFLSALNLFIKNRKKNIDDLPIRNRPFSDDIKDSLDFLFKCQQKVNAKINKDASLKAFKEQRQKKDAFYTVVKYLPEEKKRLKNELIKIANYLP